MLDLGTSFLASVARDPDALALVDGDVRLSYGEWLKRISSLVTAFERLGLRPGDHLVTALQNNWQAATVYWACQFAGLVITPVNWRVTSEELDFCIDNSEGRAVIYQGVSEAAVTASAHARNLVVMRAGGAPSRQGELSLDALCDQPADRATPRASAEAWSIMLYTSGTTSRPKGVPRRHRAERAAGLAHVAQNLYRRSERTLGVMPLYHTMGVRSLIAMSLIGGAFVCLPRFDAQRALALIAAEKITNLYLVPTLYHDLLHCDTFAQTDISSVR
jgi:2-furoate---CoA ligase